MIFNTLTAFVRILIRQKLYSAINVIGLSIGISATLMISLYIKDELSYDAFHDDASWIYRLQSDWTINGVHGSLASSGRPTAEIMKKEIPGIEATLRLKGAPVTPIEYESKSVSSKKILRADFNFFSFFDFKLIEGKQR
jgi:putative ABC transport system permease protein